MAQTEFDKEQLARFLTEETRRKHDDTRKALDELRRTRRSRGGSGAPLTIPAHLRAVAAGRPIIVTDEDLKPGTPLPDSFRANTADGGKDVKVEE